MGLHMNTLPEIEVGLADFISEILKVQQVRRFFP